MSQTVAYVRVSTDRQSLEQQRDQLAAAGYADAPLHSDTLSGSAGTERPGYAEALGALSDGDVLVVVGIDRLGRSAAEVATTVADLTQRGVTVRALRDGVDTGTAAGRMIATVLAAMAELELELGRERRAASRAARRARGLNATRPHRIGATGRREIAERYRDGEPLAHLMAVYGVGRSTVIRYAREHGCLRSVR